MQKKQAQVKMELLKALVREFQNYSDLKERLAFDPNLYGSNYSIDNVQEAVQDGFPTVAHLMIDGKPCTFLVVGEDLNGLYLLAPGEDKPKYWSSTKLRRHWTGECIIVSDVSQYGEEQAEQELEPVKRSLIIRNETKDTWIEERKDLIKQTMNCLNRLNTVPAFMLPEHPVILVFQQETPEDRKNHARAFSLGVHVYIIDPSDPVEEFLHELGHVYLDNRLDDHCKELVAELYQSLEKMDEKPGIFTAPWDYENEAELFCTLYMWRMKGMILSSGYRDILRKQWPEADKCMSMIFSYVLQKSSVQSTWTKEERQYGRYYRALMGEDVTAAVRTGNGQVKLRKAKMPVVVPKVKIQLPDSVPHRVLHKSGHKTYVQILQGHLKNAVVPLNKAGFIDAPAMERLAAQKRLGKFPVTHRRLNKAGKTVVTTHWYEPGSLEVRTTVETQIITPERASKDLSRLQKAFNSIRDAFAKIGGAENGSGERTAVLN